MTLGKELSSSTAVDQQIIIWEGEWPRLKQQVRQARLFGQCVKYHVGSVFDFSAYKTSVVGAAQTIDKAAVTQSKRAGVTYRNNPWIVPAAGIAGVSCFVFSKSTRWGIWASTRNSLVCFAVLAGLTWPHEIRRAVANKMYRSPADHSSSE